jgi:hypothetical protein
LDAPRIAVEPRLPDIVSARIPSQDADILKEMMCEIVTKRIIIWKTSSSTQNETLAVRAAPKTGSGELDDD